LSRRRVYFTTSGSHANGVKACILGAAIDQYQYKEITQPTTAVMFLSTPHFGSGLARLLQQVLGLSTFGRFSKPYLDELEQNSKTLTHINSQFLRLIPLPLIASFYETMRTSIGPVKKVGSQPLSCLQSGTDTLQMILKKDLAIFGLPDEIVEKLEADHHDVCKYSDDQDHNYVLVRDTLRRLVDQLQVKDGRLLESHQVRQVQRFLDIQGPLDEDRNAFYGSYMPGSCQRFIFSQVFKNWVNNTSDTPQFIWANGPLGVGKSVLSSHIIQHLKERGQSCQFHFFRFGEQEKKSIGTFLRSLAYQIAIDVPTFRHRLAFLSAAPDFNQMRDESEMWKKLFIRQLFQMTLSKPMYWIVDGIDECHSPNLLLRMMATLSGANLPLRIMFLSRRSDVLSKSFTELSRFLGVTEVNIEADTNDLRRYVRGKLKDVQAKGDRPELAGFTGVIEEKILGSARGNFLWTRLALESVLQCREVIEVEATLRKLHPEMNTFYRQLEEALTSVLTHLDLKFARLILAWTICSRTQLTIRELSEVLQPQFNSRPDFLSEIGRVCGGFVMINSNTSQVAIADHTAEIYLTKFSIQLRTELPSTHGLLFHKCLSVLCKLSSNFPDQDLALDSRYEIEPLLKYSTSSWFYHLSKCNGTLPEESVQLLVKFLNSSHALVWISIVTSVGQLQSIVEAAETLRSFLLQQQQQPNPEHYKTVHHQDDMRVIERWAIDMLQITAKFGDHLVTYPRAIYSLIPAFCPESSIVRKFSYNGLFSVPSVKVTGVSPIDWDECLARFSIGKNCNATRILCTDDHFAVSTMPLNGPAVDGCVSIYRTRTCEEMDILKHGEAVLNMQFSASGRLLATSGTQHIRIWTAPAGVSGAVPLLCSFANPDASRLLALAFSVDDKNIITYSQDGYIRRLSLGSMVTSWEVVGVALGGLGTPRVIGPSCAAFNHDASLIAVGFRGAPMAVWNLTPFQPCQYHQRSTRSWTAVNSLEWNYKSGHVFGLYDDGCLFKWNPSEVDEVHEFPANAINISCTLKGNVFATSSGNSSITIWDSEHCLPMYELSLPAGVADLAMSPDGLSVYDLRESYCTIWQPISLIRRNESTSSRDIADKKGTPVPVANSHSIPNDVTALVVGQETFLCCIGNMDGFVQLIGEDNRRAKFEPSYKAPIEHVACSLDEKYLATANFGNQMLVRAVELAAFDREEAIDIDAGKIIDENLDGPVRQLLFNKSSKLVFAATERSLHIWELGEQPRLVARITVHKQYRWINHPGDDQLLLGFAFDALRALRWQDLEQAFELEIEPPPSSNLGIPSSQDALGVAAGVALESISSVGKVLTSFDGTIAFLQVAAPFIYTHKVHDEFFILHTAGITNPQCDVGQQTRLIPLPRHLQALIQVPIGFVNAAFDIAGPGSSPSAIDTKESHLAFLSNEGWICTMYLGGEEVPARVKNHYLLPRDWLVKDALELAQITAAGTFFCPRNGEVGMIRDGLGTGWAK
jgi:WD40 repeat protein